VMDDEYYFTAGGNEWQQESYYESEDHPATGDVKFISKTKFPAKVLLRLAVSASGIWTLSKGYVGPLEELKIEYVLRKKIRQTSHRYGRSKIFGRT
jgi:hypothetical protein